MASLQESVEWTVGIYQLETSDPVLGGPEGIDNLQAKQLANRTKWLRERLLAYGAGYTGTVAHDVSGDISAADAGKMVYFFGANQGQSLTLPTASSLTPGNSLTVQNVGSYPVAITRSGADVVQPLSASGSASVVSLYPGSQVQFTCVSATEWFVQGTGVIDRLKGLPLLAPGTNTGQVASAAFVQQENAGELATAAPLVDGLASVGVSLKKAREDHRHPIDTSRAPLDSPAFTGLPTAPTPAQGSNNSQISTTAFVSAAIAALINSSPGALDTLNELAAALGNDPNFAATMSYYLSLKAPLANAALTGTPTVPLALQFNDTNQIASTSFVRSAGSQFGGVAAYTESAALPASVAGKLTYFFGPAVNQVLTLPLAAALPVGARVQIQNLSTNNVSVNRGGADNVQIAGSMMPTVVIPGGTEAIFTCIGAGEWFVQGSAVLGKMAHFASLKSANGWEKSPSGLIHQWGFAANGDQSTGTSIILPITYPTANLSTVVCAYNSTGDIDHAYIGDMYTTYFNLFTQSMSSNGGPWMNNEVAARWISYGY